MLRPRLKSSQYPFQGMSCSDNDVIDLCDSSASESGSEGQRGVESSSNKTKASHFAGTSSVKRKLKRPRLGSEDEPTNQYNFPGIKESKPASPPFLILQTDPGEQVTITDGLVPLLRACEGDMNQHQTTILFCRSPTLLHMQQGDKWSCGFRNLQMLLSALLPLLPTNHCYFIDRPLHSPGAMDIASLLQIQHILEQAWSAGMDRKGSEHYKSRLAHTKAWIGAVEVATALNFCQIDATVVQFITVPDSRDQLGPFCEAYFSRCHGCTSSQDDPYARTSHSIARHLLACLKHKEPKDDQRPTLPPCTCRPSVPLYLQYQGHSVAIVGVEYKGGHNGRVASPGRKNVSNLLVLDPMRKGSVITAALTRRDLRPLRRSCSELQSKDCQIILCSTEEWKTQPLAVVTAEAEAVLRYRQSRP